MRTFRTDAVKWNGRNTDEVVQYLKDHDYNETRQEKRPDGKFDVKVGDDWLNIPKDHYLTIDETGAIDTIPAQEFEKYFEHA